MCPDVASMESQINKSDYKKLLTMFISTTPPISPPSPPCSKSFLSNAVFIICMRKVIQSSIHCFRGWKVMWPMARIGAWLNGSLIQGDIGSSGIINLHFCQVESCCYLALNTNFRWRNLSTIKELTTKLATYNGIWNDRIVHMYIVNLIKVARTKAQ